MPARYRYQLERHWDESRPQVLFIGLNPSTADASHDDPTVRRCIRFARDWGYGGLLLGNLYAFRATRPRELAAAGYPVGRGNNRALQDLASRADALVAAWGNDGHELGRDRRVMRLLGRPLLCLGTTARGAPRHPLYVRASVQPQAFAPVGGQGRGG